MILAREKLGKKFIFLIFILGIIASFAFFFPPSNLVFILLMNILVSSFFYFALKIFLTKKLTITLLLPIFLIITLLSLKLFDPLNLILVVFLSIAVGLLIK
ncbi:MAG: hypothetical protein AAB441_01815 [Patescibacteria group bacterium]